MKTMKKNPDRKPASQDQRVENNKIKRFKSRFKTLPSLISEFINIKNVSQATQPNYSRMFFVLGLCISLLLVITAFEWKFYDEGTLITLNNMDMDFEDILEVPVTEQPPPPLPKIIQPRIIEVPDEETITEEIEVDLDIQMDEDMKFEDIIREFYNEIPAEPVDKIFIIVEQKPVPVGGMKAFYEFIGENLKYPAQAQRMGIEGKVFVKFIVDKEGIITNVQCLKGIGAGCDEEAIRVVQDAPVWLPGKQRGQPVKVQMILPIHFKLK